MSGKCIEKLNHVCGSSDGLQVFEENGRVSGFCFSCNTYVRFPYGDNPIPVSRPKLVKTDEQMEKELQEVATLHSLSLPERKLEDWALDYFGVKVAVSEEDGKTPSVVFFPYTADGTLLHYKGKIIESKQFFRAGHKGEVDPFGWTQALHSEASRLYITEGEEDAVALYQALKLHNKNKPEYAHLNPAVISLANGSSGAKKDVSRIANTAKHRFKEAILVFDMDEQGRKAAQAVLQILPLAKTVTLPCKDANECLIQGRANALCSSVLFKNEKPKNTRLIWGPSLYEQAKIPATYGLSWPWDGMTKLTRGIRFGETIYVGAGVKMGKSTVVDALSTHLMLEHGLKVFLAKPEEANLKTIKKVLGYSSGHIFHDPNISFDSKAYDEAVKQIGDKLCLLSLYQQLDWQTLKGDIVSAVHEGCKAVFIDPITNLTNGISSAEANVELQGIAQDLSAMSLDMDFVAFIFCHLKAPLSGEPHERGGEVQSNQFAGSRAMMRSANYMIGLQGNKHPDLSEEERNTRQLVMNEDREFGSSGKINLYYNPITGLLTEI